MLLETSPYLGHLITTEVVVWGICIGAMLAFTVYFVQMRVLGSLVRALMDSARDENSAKTLDELGKNNAFYRHSTRDNSVLRRIVSVVGGEIPKNADGELDYALARFYIDEEKLPIAEKRYSKDVKIYMYVIGIVACVAVGVIMHFVFPWLLTFLPEL